MKLIIWVCALATELVWFLWPNIWTWTFAFHFVLSFGILPLETPSPGDGSYLQNYTNSTSVIDVPSTGAPSKKVLCVPDAITVLYVYLKRRIHYVDLKKEAKHCKWVPQLDCSWSVISLAELFRLLRSISWNGICCKIVCVEVVTVSQFLKSQQKVYYFENLSLQLSK